MVAVNAVNPVFDQAPEATVVVPKLVDPPEYTVMVVPSASELVPDTVVAPAHNGELTTGVAKVPETAVIGVIIIFPTPPTPPVTFLPLAPLPPPPPYVPFVPAVF